MKASINFSKTDYLLFIISIILLTIGFLLMAMDPEENGFGIQTLWIAPPLLLAGFALPCIGIIGGENFITRLKSWIKPLEKAKHLFAFLSFLIALIVYILTLEPTASLWDCSEFIAAAYKLQVPHTPGNPLFLLIGRVFTMLSFGDVKAVAWCMNLMSALFSAGAVYLLFLIIYQLGMRLKVESKFTLIMASLVGSLFMAFSDSFWFSAVEAETYAIASFFLVLLVWMGLKGGTLSSDLKPRWFILIFYILGLSYCIHPMCLLAIPVIFLSLFLKDSQIKWKSILIISVLGFAVLLLINRFVAVGIFELAFSFDRFFVNSIGLPFYSGAIVFTVLLIGLFAFIIKKYPSFQSWSWATVFVIFGFMPYLLLFIRSNHNPPIDETNPENLSMIRAYMNRDSYGSRPLLYGQYFDAQVTDISVKRKAYSKRDDRYEFAGNISEYHYDDSRKTILPRIYSSSEDHQQTYRSWLGLRPDEKPDFIDNLKFMFTYQLGHMYFRYLMFNFSGRTSDIQHEEWLKPWELIQSNAPIQNKARNQYFMLPFLIGLLGMFYQFNRDKKGFWTTMLFFFITGIILVLYLNSPPNEPRERDYIYVGSFIAFCIWIGIGVMALVEILANGFLKSYQKLPDRFRYLYDKKTNHPTEENPKKLTKVSFFKNPLHLRLAKALTLLFTFTLLSWVFYQNFDDHDRSERTFQIDNARNLLNTCAPNAILFTGGDNDTFPLWYLQEVEGFRTDVRVMVLSYFNTDWYISQLRKKYYESEAFDFTLSQYDYRQYGPNDVLYVQPNDQIKGAVNAEKYLQLLKDEHPALRVQTRDGDYYHVLPSKSIKINVDRNNRSDLPAGSQLSEEVILEVKGNYLEKNALALIDLIISNDWKRPIYFNITSMNSIGLKINPYLVQEGQIFRFLPVKNDSNTPLRNKEKMYTNLIENADYSNLSNEDVYFNYEDYHARMIVPLRQNMNALAEAYLRKNDHQKAEEIMNYSLDHLYYTHLCPSYADLNASRVLWAMGNREKAKELAVSVYDYYERAFDGEDMNTSSSQGQFNFYILREAAALLQSMGQEDYVSRWRELVEGKK